MELNSLRSHLQHACPDLRNLTNGELEECKWLTKKKVFINLISSSRLLQDYHEELADLNDERNAESSLMKREGTSREIRLESETVYRTKFMRIVLSALTRLKWPPALEAFADPLDSLFNDPSTFRDAVQFLLQVAISSAALTTMYDGDTSHLKPPRPKSDGSRRAQAMDTSGDGPSPFDVSLSALSHDLSDLNVSTHSVKPDISHSMISSYGCEQIDFTPRTPLPHQDTISSPGAEKFELSTHHVNESKQALNWKAFELLQRQNEVLSVRLRELQLSVLKRDESETKISGILSELKSAIAEIVEAGSVDCGRQQTPKKGGAISSSEGSILRDKAVSSTASTTALSKEQEMEAFRLEVEREKEEQLSQKDKSLGISQLGSTALKGTSSRGKDGNSNNGKPSATRASPSSSVLCSKCAAPVSAGGSAVGSFSSSAPNVLWSKLHSRLSALEAQWNSAQRTARNLAEGHDDHYSSAAPKLSPKRSSPPARFSRSGAGSMPMAAGVLCSAQSTPSRCLVNRAYGVQPALIAGVEESRFKEIKRGQGIGADSFGDVYSSPPQPPASRQSQQSGHHTHTAAANDLSNCGLDLQRVHLLQRDLIAFAERAFAWTSQSLFIAAPPESAADLPSQSRGADRSASTRRGQPSPSVAQYPDALPLSEQAARRQQEAQELQHASWDLLLHLSGVAPIVPLALDSPLKSSMTGLEALINETAELAYPKISKQAQLRLQAAADRALAEQLATIRCWRQTRSCLVQWVAHATRIAPTLKMLGRRHKSNVDRAAEDLSALSAGLGLISEALGQAETVRIRPGGTSASASSGVDEESAGATMLRVGSGHTQRSVAPISPLDSLARGSAGKEVAALVNALRANQDALSEATQTVRTLGAKLTTELKRDLNVVASTENNLLFAADLSENVLDTAQSSETAFAQVQSGVTSSRKASTGRSKRAGSENVSAKPSTLDSRPAFDLSLS